MNKSIEDLVADGFAARRSSRQDVALATFDQAVRQARDGGTAVELIHALKGLGQIRRDMGQRRIALELYLEAGRLSRNVENPRLLAHTIRHVADIHQELDEIDLAEPLYVEALQIYRDHPDTTDMDLGNTIRPYAILLEARGRTDEARENWLEARALYAKAGVQAGVDEANEHLDGLG